MSKERIISNQDGIDHHRTKFTSKLFYRPFGLLLRSGETIFIYEELFIHFLLPLEPLYLMMSEYSLY